ncbi:MAG: hypothetical protein ACTSRG_26945 [Candidatus Helarchaeota archaeon]
MTIYTDIEINDFIRDLKEFNSREAWIATEALLDTMYDILTKRRDE